MYVVGDLRKPETSNNFDRRIKCIFNYETQYFDPGWLYPHVEALTRGELGHNSNLA
jgi:hypothetical protein